MVVLVLALAGAITLMAVQVTPDPNGLGVLPGQEVIMEHSGVTLETPVGKPAIGAQKAAAAATKSQPQAQVDQVFLATTVGEAGSQISPPGRLCWVVFLNPGSNPAGAAQVPGQIELDAVLVDARSGAVIEGFISFHGTTPNSQVGTE